VSEPNPRDALVEAARGLVDAAAARDPALQGAAIVAIGWATVELDRAERELSKALGLGDDGASHWALATRDPVLGATARVGPVLRDGPRLVLLAPDTEGRLAATLARHGEGVAAVYVTTRAGTDLVIGPALTSAPVGRPPTALAGHLPSGVD